MNNDKHPANGKLKHDEHPKSVNHSEDRAFPGSQPKKRKWPYIKALLTLCVSFCLTFTAFLAIQNLQSSINSDSGLGVISLACVYAGFAIGNLFSPAYIYYLGPKWSIVTGLAGQCVFTISNFYPRFYTLVPSSLIFGLLNAPLWAAHGVYLTQLAIDYALDFEVNSVHIISRFNGVFFTFFQLAQIIGSLVSSLILFSGNTLEDDLNNNHTNKYLQYRHEKPSFTSIIARSATDELSNKCGSSFCSLDDSPSNDNVQVPNHILYLLIGIYSTCSVLALIIFTFCAENRKSHSQSPKDDNDKNNREKQTSDSGVDISVVEAGDKNSAASEVLATLRTHKQLTLWLIIPSFIWSGVEQSIMFGEYTQAFLSCHLGLQYVGYGMVCFGVTDAIFCLLSGPIQKITGRVVIFIAGFLLNIALLLLMLFWSPSLGDTVLYVIPALWGIADVIWNATTCALIGVIFAEQQAAAFSAFRLWQALGFCVMFGISSVFCMAVKIYVGLGICCFAMCMYIIMELRFKVLKYKVDAMVIMGD